MDFNDPDRFGSGSEFGVTHIFGTRTRISYFNIIV